jgi:hypothetical protein
MLRGIKVGVATDILVALGELTWQITFRDEGYSETEGF